MSRTTSDTTTPFVTSMEPTGSSSTAPTASKVPTGPKCVTCGTVQPGSSSAEPTQAGQGQANQNPAAQNAAARGFRNRFSTAWNTYCCPSCDNSRIRPSWNTLKDGCCNFCNSCCLSNLNKWWCILIMIPFAAFFSVVCYYSIVWGSHAANPTHFSEASPYYVEDQTKIKLPYFSVVVDAATTAVVLSVLAFFSFLAVAILGTLIINGCCTILGCCDDQSINPGAGSRNISSPDTSSTDDQGQASGRSGEEISDAGHRKAARKLNTLPSEDRDALEEQEKAESTPLVSLSKKGGVEEQAV